MRNVCIDAVQDTVSRDAPHMFHVAIADHRRADRNLQFLQSKHCRFPFRDSHQYLLRTRYVMRFLLLLAALVLIAVRANEFELKLSSDSNCDAGATVVRGKDGSQTYIGNAKYRIIEAHIYWTDAFGKILGIAVCNVPGSRTCTENQPFPSGAQKKYLVLVVTLVDSSFEDQNIHYQYFDELFKLSKVNHPSSHQSSNDIFNLNNFLLVSSATYKTSAGDLKLTTTGCSKSRAKSLISGHGYFITEFEGSAVWENLYYLPHRIGQYIKTPN